VALALDLGRPGEQSRAETISSIRPVSSMAAARSFRDVSSSCLACRYWSVDLMAVSGLRISWAAPAAS